MDLLLNPSTGDLEISTGSIQTVESTNEIAQQLRIRLRFFLGEWFLDTRLGVPYFQSILGKKLRGNLIEAYFRKTILTTPGVTTLANFRQSFDGASRQLSVTFTVTTTLGEVLVFDEEFIVA